MYATLPNCSSAEVVASPRTAERDALVAEKAKERVELQKQIAALNAEREKHLEAERQKSAASGARGLDDAMFESLRSAAAKKSISL